MTYQFSTLRFRRTMRFIGYSCATVASICAITLLAGGQDFFMHFTPQNIKPFYLADKETIDHGQASLFLFPGKSSMLGMFYVALVAFFLLSAVILLPWSIWRTFTFSGYEHIGEIEKFYKRNPIASLALLPLTPLILHLTANLHWQFYCAVGAVESFNCFWVFDGRSLLIGFAGLIGLSILALALSIIAFFVYQVYRLLCYLSCFKRVEKDTSTFLF